MYKVKRFSQCKEKDFNALTDLAQKAVHKARHARRVVNTKVGRARNKVADKILESAEKDRTRWEESAKKVFRGSPSMDIEATKELNKKLLRNEAHPNKFRVLGHDLSGEGGSFMANSDSAKQISKYINGDTPFFSTKKVDKSMERLSKKISNSADKSDAVIFYPKGGPEYLAHELGHAKRHKGNIVERISHVAAVNPITQGITQSQYLGGGIDASLSNAVLGKLARIEEAGASKKGLEMLKKAGATEEQLAAAKKSLDTAYDTYKYSNRYKTKMPLYNMVATKGKKKYMMDKLNLD